MASPVAAATAESATSTAGTSHTINLPTGITAGDLLVIVLDKGSTAATVNALAGWTELLDENSANGLYIAYRKADGTEGSTITLTTSASTRTATIAYRITGAADPATRAPEIGTTATGTSATPDPPAITPTGGSKDYLFIACAGMAGEEADDDTWGNTPPTNYTPSPPLQSACGVAGTNLGGLILAASRQFTASTDDPGTFGVDVSAAWRAQTIAVHPPPPGAVAPAAGATAARTAPVPEVRVSPPALAATAATNSGGVSPTIGPLASAATASAPVPTVDVGGTTVTAVPAAATASRVTPVLDVRVTAPAGAATASRAAPTPEVRVSPAASAATASRVEPVISTGGGATTVTAPPAVANGNSISGGVSITVGPLAGSATASRAAPVPEVRLLPAAAGATANPGGLDEISIDVLPLASSATASRAAPVVSITIVSPAASATASRTAPVINIAGAGGATVSAPAAVANANSNTGDVSITVGPTAAGATASRSAPSVVSGTVVVSVAGVATASRAAPTVTVGGATVLVVSPAGLATASRVRPRIRKSHHFVLVPDTAGGIVLRPDQATPASPHLDEPAHLTGELTMRMNTPT